ncbi:MAG: TerB family tellurite resistance protein [Candidatus Pedobacter colombiensis]|uniref:TerB family tellurite resistance protein n=1 Tax=Candidatus Pedobacter colombiensis TaxID=3121371 RepID=A0AAJ6B7R0_9SPHI|nr:TerB family tellurite resistance protein [Pedobacter sp.]WEK21362.1 MAG: TerB family tellurite resistance protein [Pedobacter sp.]
MIKLKICLLAVIMAGSMVKAKAQADELAQLALNIEKLAQFKQILSDLKSGYQIISNGYGTIKDISEGNFSIHKTFLDGLYAISPQVRKYRKVVQIIEYQIVLVKEYKAAYAYFKKVDVFNPNEISYLANVYERLFKSSLRNLEELTMIVTAGQLRMSDDERLKAIDGIHADMEDKVMFLRSFNNQTGVLTLQREKEQNDIRYSQKLHAVK